jgi:hypothetical protein
LLDFEKANPGITVAPWGLEEFRLVFRKLRLNDLQSWFGFVPSDETKAELRFDDLRLVLEAIAAQSIPASQTVKDVPTKKIEANALSESVATLLKAGMTKAPLVKDFFERWHDETLGERVAKSFREKYQSLRGTLHPDAVFSALEAWAGGADRGSPQHQLAVLTTIAYYFDSCDIFEEPRTTAL